MKIAVHDTEVDRILVLGQRRQLTGGGVGHADLVPDSRHVSVRQELRDRHSAVVRITNVGIPHAIGGVGYGLRSAANLNRLVDEKHIPVMDKSKRDDGTLSREDFIAQNLRRLAITIARSPPPAAICVE